jgi:hypothetical protein
MATKKTTGKQLADMLYGNPEGAAFGVYPQAGKRGQRIPSAKEQLAKIMADERAMEMPQFGEVDLSVPTAGNRAMGQRMVERDVDLKRQADRDMSPLEKLAGGIQTGRLMGSGLVQAAKSIPTAITKGGKAAEDYIAENIYQPNQPKAYEYAQDVGDFLSSLETDYKIPPVLPEAVALQYLAGPAKQQAKRGALQAGMKLERGMEPIVQRAMESGGLPREMVMAMGNNTQSNVIKPKNGNWLTGSVEGALKPLKRSGGLTPQDIIETEAHLEKIRPSYDLNNPVEARQLADMENHVNVLKANLALDQWVDSNLTNYVKKEMATPGDPVRKVAEEGISHMPANEIDYANAWLAEDLAVARMKAGFSPQDVGVSNTAKGWERLADEMMNIAPASQHTRPLTQAEIRQGVKSTVDDNPWLTKVDPDTPIYYPHNMDTMSRDFGFDHIMDVLREDLASGRIRPEKLNTVSMEQAVRRTAEYDQELAAKMNAERAAKRDGLPVYKEYPEGYRWVELNKPGAFASESEAMGHSVRGYEPPQGHPDWVEGSGDRGSLRYGHGGWEGIKSGKAKVYSLVGPKGEPHVTVEVGRPELKFGMTAGDIDPYRERLRQQFPDLNDEKIYYMAVDEFTKDQTANLPPRITQIKGKQNAAPNEAYLPYVQDFVKSGQWSDVGDLGNTGLYSASDAVNYMPKGIHMSRGAREQAIDRARAANDLPNYMTPEEYEAMLQKHVPEDVWRYEKEKRAAEDDELLRQLQPPPEGMARGGRVHFSDNPDVMQLELAKGGAVRMQVGGLARMGAKGATKGAAKAAKVEKELALPPVLPRAPAKTKEEIRPYAQRMAQQMTGEFYRPNPKKSENVAGKSFSQFKMEKGLDHDIRPTREVVEPEVADIEKQLGMLKIGISGDTTIADKVLHRAGPYELFDPSPQHGGPRYGLGGEGAWASNNPIAATVQKRVNELSEAYGAPPLGQYMAMGPQGSNFAQHFADANLQAIDTSAMTKAQIEQINKLIREGSQKSGPRPSFPGIEDRGSAYLHFAIDPELRKHFNDLMQKTSVTEKLNLPDGRIILHAITEPELRDKEILNTGFSQMRLKSAFDPESLQISAHPTYSHVIPHEEGSAVTRTKYLTPGELEFSDVLDYAKQHYRPQDMTRVFQTSTPRQIVDPQHIDEMKMYEELMKEYTGKKKGGEVKAPAAQIDGNQFVVAAQKYGLDDDMGTLNKMVSLVNMGATVDEAARALSDGAVRKAGGGEVHGLSTADLLYLQSQEDLGKLPAHAQREAITNMGGQEVRQRMAGKYAGGGEITADDLILEERKL